MDSQMDQLSPDFPLRDSFHRHLDLADSNVKFLKSTWSIFERKVFRLSCKHSVNLSMDISAMVYSLCYMKMCSFYIKTFYNILKWLSIGNIIEVY